MTITNAAIIVDSTTGQELMAVIPDTDEQLKDPSYNQPGTMQILVPIDEFNAMTPEDLAASISTALAKAGITPQPAPETE